MKLEDLQEEMHTQSIKLAVIELQQKEAKEERQEMKVLLQQLVSRMDKYDGKFGGILLMLGAIWAFVKLFGAKIGFLGVGDR